MTPFILIYPSAIKVNMPNINKQRPRNLAQQLVADLSESIARGHIKPGDKLPTESAIMTQYGVSRTVVREAISRLQASGTVETRHGIGTFVLQAPNEGKFRIDPASVVTLEDIIAILELRISLEVESAGLAAKRRTKQQLKAMREALDALLKSQKQGKDAVFADFQFHSLIAQATANQYFSDILNHLGTTIIPRTRVNFAKVSNKNQQEYLERVNKEHEDIFESIARQDSDSARAAMRLHLTNSRERLRSLHPQGKSSTSD